MRAYYAGKISENMARTPEGFLICYNVPIARTGVQEYWGRELNIRSEYADKLIKVHRYPEDVFNPAALASFEGKPVTDDHPHDKVRPDNISRYLKGVAANVRQGNGEDADKVVADLIIYDSILISEIETGKREISCGYDCIYEQNEKGELCQRQIEGNHIAVVGEGRAGGKVAIKDEQPPKTERRKKFMSKKNNINLNGVRNNASLASALARIFPMFSKDAAPEDISDAVEALVETISGNQQQEPVVNPVPAPQGEDNAAQAAQDNEAAAAIKQLTDVVQKLSALVEGMKTNPAPVDSLDKLEKELSGEEQLETSNDDSEETITSSDENPVKPVQNADHNAVLKEIRAIKPVIAQIKDEKTKKLVTDSLTRLYRQSLGLTSADAKTNAYAGILNTKQIKAQQLDAKSHNAVVNDEQLGRDIAKKYNPHYKNK